MRRRWAAAKKFVTRGFVPGAPPQDIVKDRARQEAQVVGAQNMVGGQAVQIAGGDDGDVAFDFNVANNPRITVTVQRTAAAGNPVPTFFGKAIGIANGDISAVAT